MQVNTLHTKTKEQLRYITSNMRMYPRNYALAAKKEVARRHKKKQIRLDIDKFQYNEFTEVR